MNISSVIVIPAPERTDAVAAALRVLPCVEVALVSPEGKIIITIEAAGDKETVETFDAVSRQEGVLSASMVFHQLETEPEHPISVEA